MNRVIKFRGKYSRQHPWVYGDLHHDYDGSYYTLIENINIDEMSSIDHPVDSSSVGQFTGLKDKNGVEIYEGDILAWEKCEGKKYQTRWVVEYNPAGGFKSWSSTDNDEIVIGNIYEHPELLNK